MAAQAIDLKVNNGGAEAAIDAVGDSLDDLGKLAIDAGENLASLEKSLNAFLTTRGKAEGRTPRLFDLKADKAELEDLLKKWQEVINLQSNIRGPLNTAGQGVGNRPATPGQIAPMPGESGNDVAKRIEYAITRLLRHHLNTNQNPANTATANSGLTYEQMTGRPSSPTGDPVAPPRRPAQNDSHFGQVAHQAIKGLHSAGTAGGLAASAIEGAAGSSGLGAMGMLKGGAIGALAYGAYKTVAAAGGAVMDKMDAGKTENIEVDKFKRSLGMTADSFADLKNKSRAVGEQFLLTYEQSRKLTTDFAGIARSNVNGAGLAGVGIGLAQSVGVDEEQGSSYMANMRRSGALSEKTADARLLAIQFAEALKRTGSTLNASDLMRSISGFASATSQRSLLAPNTEGYAGILSAMVGSGAPGLKGNVDNAAAILNHADAAFQGGGSMGEASKTLQFQSLKGNETGLLGVKMRQAAGMFATGNQVFGNKEGQVNKFLGGDGMTRFGGDKSGLEQVLERITGSGMSKEAQLMAAGNHFQNMNPEQMATLLNLKGDGKLSGMTSLISDQTKEHPELKDKFEKMSPFGYESLAEITDAKGDQSKLSGIRSKLAQREGLTDVQKSDLKGMGGLSGKPLQDALVKFTTTLEREKTAGEQAQDSAAKTAQATSRLVDGLIPAAQAANTFLSALVEKLAPDSPIARKIKQEEEHRSNFEFREKVDSGGTTIGERKKKGEEFDDARTIELRRVAVGLGNAATLKNIEKNRIRALGDVNPTLTGDERKQAILAKDAIDAEYRDYLAKKRGTPIQSQESDSGNDDVLSKHNALMGPSTIDTKGDRIVTRDSLLGKKTSKTGILAKDAIANSAEKYGINPTFLQGLSLLETGLGAKSIKGPTGDTNNLFNIKDVTGKGARAFDAAEGSRDAYMGYGSYAESADAAASLIARKYPSAAKAKTPEEFSLGLKGYATDPDHASKVTNSIKRLQSESSAVSLPPRQLSKQVQSAEQKQDIRPVSFNDARVNNTIDVIVHNGNETQTHQVQSSGVLKPRPQGIYA